MNYVQTLDYIFEKLPMFHRVGAAAFKKDLTNILALCELLDNPQHKFKSIHIAGTNGKGSTSYMMAAILQANGFKTGLYISPHYKDFRERIRINGLYIPKKNVVAFIEKLKVDIEKIQPSFFEIGVAMAFDYFASQQVDIAVVETGLGGRLDSTNIINPLLSVITNISFDHQNLLGETLPLIAVEKAGIIKPNTPVIIGETQSEVKAVFEQEARLLNAPITFADKHFSAKIIEQTFENIVFDVQPKYDKLSVNLSGDYQSKNIVTVLAVLDVLQKQGIKLNISDIRFGLAQLKSLTRFMGRWQQLGDTPLIIADSAHNVGGLQYVMLQLRQLAFKKLHIVMGMVNDKDIDKMLQLFPENATYYFCKANIPRGMAARMLQEKASAFGLHGKVYFSVKRALAAAKKSASPDDVIYVGGSTFVVAEVL
ncbi:MAG: bifunctional folylpolyglutamate synthase/dihydrofolate synthase [Saprospiraceae bacterium]|nr:bifunctional folylpolyglutamate synthase/dihydrofolate synthase [Saprospiraceae bacterium]MBP7699313.1 bifunctional folylpolyglutamate synthase/dihydrofolate synthase [Saprospiraceae bacterium]